MISAFFVISMPNNVSASKFIEVIGISGCLTTLIFLNSINYLSTETRVGIKMTSKLDAIDRPLTIRFY